MPLIDIYLHQGVTTREQRKAISDAIHAAMVETLAIPDDDRFHFSTNSSRGRCSTRTSCSGCLVRNG